MKKVCYIHGAFSAFSPESEKVQALQERFEVVGISYSVENTFDENLKLLTDFCDKEEVDFVVGTSLGGLYAAEINHKLGLPAIMINPCVEPQMSLSTIIGEHQNFATGKIEKLTESIVKTYPNLAAVSESCLIFVGLKDDLIDNTKTISMYNSTTKVIADEEADHYWQDFNKNEEIEKHVKRY